MQHCAIESISVDLVQVSTHTIVDVLVAMGLVLMTLCLTGIRP